MAYSIPPETIERVRSQADIVQLISEYLTLKKAGANYKALCPFHREKTPSFMVNPAKQIYHCFGCGAGGNVFGFLMRQEGFSFPEAVRFLAERMGVQIKQEEYASGQREIREHLFELYEFATGFFRKNLLKSPQAENARKYLQNRHLYGDGIKQFSMGYALPGWDSLLSAASKKGFSKDLLLQGGLIKKNAEGRTYDAFRDRIIFPVWGLSGKVIAFGGRTLGEDQPKYINSPETLIFQKSQILYNLHRAKNSISNIGSVIVVEGYTDIIRLVMNGIENVVASSGTAFTNQQARMIKRYASDVTLVFDPDSAGVAAAQRGIEVLLAEDLEIKVLVLPSGEDPDEFVLKQGPEAFLDATGKAKNFVEFHIEKALAGQHGNSLENKIKTANTLSSLLAKIPDAIRKDEYLRVAASRLDIKPEILLKASQKGDSKDRIIEEDAGHFEKKLRHEEKEFMWLIKHLVERPQYILQVRDSLDISSIRNKALKRLFEEIFSLGESFAGGSSLFDRIQSQEAQQMLSHLMFEQVGPEVLYPVEWWKGFIVSRQKEKECGELSAKISEVEKTGDIKLLEQLLRKKAEISRELATIKKDMMKVSVYLSAESAVSG